MEEESPQTVETRLEEICSTLDEMREALVNISVSLQEIARK